MAQVHSVEAPDQLAIFPYFIGMCVAHSVQGAIPLDKPRVDPAAHFPLACYPGTILDHPIEALVPGQGKGSVSHNFAHALGYFKPIRKKDHPGVRRPPINQATAFEPGKYPFPIGQQKTLGAQVPSQGQQPILPGQMDGRKLQAMVQKGNGPSAIVRVHGTQTFPKGAPP